MLLTIGMIVKNEEKMLRRCLEALQPILKNLDSELIIVDTGSTDSTVEIAKEFTDKVLFYEWTKDFAAARNVSLDAAQGEWFMAVDADEVFLSGDDIVRFFKSGEYKEYNSAVFPVRNYSNPENKVQYSDFYVPRLVMRRPETKYVGAIHETFTTFGQPIRVLTDVAEHYGYNFDSDPEVAKEKLKRNTELLQKRLETEERETSPSLYKELIETFSLNDNSYVNENFHVVKEYVEKGIEICNKQKNEYIFALYQCVIIICSRLERFDDVLKIYDAYFKIDNEIRKIVNRSTDIDIIGFAANALFLQKKYKEAYKLYLKYFDLYELMEDNKLCTTDVLYISRRLASPIAKCKVEVQYATCCLNLKKYKDAENSFRRSPLANFEEEPVLYGNRIRQEIFLLTKYTPDEIGKLFGNSDEKLRKELFEPLRYVILNADEGDRIKIINRLAGINFKSAAQRQIVAIYKEHFIGKGAGDAKISAYVEKHGMDCPDLLCIMVAEGINPYGKLAKCENLEEFIGKAFNTIDGLIETTSRLSIAGTANADVYTAIRTYFFIMREYSRRKLVISEMLKPVGDLGMMYLTAFGEKDIPQEALAAVTMAEINILRSKRDYKGCIDALRRLIQIDKRYAAVAAEYQKVIKTEMDLYLR